MNPNQRRWIIRIAAALGCVVAIYFFPLFYVVPLGQAEQQGMAAPEKFDPAGFVDKFWSQQLIPGQSNAVDAATLVAAIKADPQSAKAAHGRTVGLGGAYLYFLSGTGRVLELNKNSIGLAIEDGAKEVQVALETGPIFGNAVRDATGLLDVNNFSNSQDFNKVSSELNRRVETDVLPKIRENATIGAKIRFVGCVQISDEGSDLFPLRVVPFVGEGK